MSDNTENTIKDVEEVVHKPTVSDIKQWADNNIKGIQEDVRNLNLYSAVVKFDPENYPKVFILAKTPSEIVDNESLLYNIIEYDYSTPDNFHIDEIEEVKTIKATELPDIEGYSPHIVNDAKTVALKTGDITVKEYLEIKNSLKSSSVQTEKNNSPSAERDESKYEYNIEEDVNLVLKYIKRAGEQLTSLGKDYGYNVKIEVEPSETLLRLWSSDPLGSEPLANDELYTSE